MSARLHRADAHRLLLRALQAKAGAGTALDLSRSESWASATFRGARHTVRLRLTGENAPRRATRLAAEVDGIEFDLPGHLVADIGVRSLIEQPDGTALEIEALTVEDA